MLRNLFLFVALFHFLGVATAQVPDQKLRALIDGYFKLPNIVWTPGTLRPMSAKTELPCPMVTTPVATCYVEIKVRSSKAGDECSGDVEFGKVRFKAMSGPVNVVWYLTPENLAEGETYKFDENYAIEPLDDRSAQQQLTGFARIQDTVVSWANANSAAVEINYLPHVLYQRTDATKPKACPISDPKIVNEGS